MIGQQYPIHYVPVAPMVTKNRTVNDVIPGSIPGLLGALQTILWLAITALEGVSIYYDAGRGTIYAGFWCSFPFFLTWVSMFCYLCCGKSNGCGIYLIVINSICLIFSIFLMIFTSIFVKNPCRCYDILCSIPPWDSLSDWDILGTDFGPWMQFECTGRTLQKLPFLKGLLACAVLMFVSNLSYVIIYIGVSIWLRTRGNGHTEQPGAFFQKQLASVDFNQQQYQLTPMSYPPQINEQSSSVYPINDGYHQSSPKKPVSQWQPSDDFNVETGRF